MHDHAAPDRQDAESKHGADDSAGAHHCSTHPSALMVELREHIPFSITAVALGLIAAGTICILGSILHAPQAVDRSAPDLLAPEHDHEHEAPAGSRAESEHDEHDHGPAFARNFFHLFHPAHMLFSAAATTAMFWRYERRLIKAIIVGLLGAIGVCGVSDIVAPHISLLILGVHTPWHICVIEHPGMVLPFAGIGVVVGLAAALPVARPTIFSHSLHVLASTMATIFYLVGPLGVVEWINRIGVVFLFVAIAVVTPCCLSDIVFPMLMTKAGRRAYEQQPHTH